MGYGQITPKTAKNMFLTLLLQVSGILLYGFTFQLVISFIKKSRRLRDVKRDIKEDLESWLIARERRGGSWEKRGVVKKIKEAFDFLWAWDIQSSFECHFYDKLAWKSKESLFLEFGGFFVQYFSGFFKCLEEDVCGDVIRSMIPI